MNRRALPAKDTSAYLRVDMASWQTWRYLCWRVACCWLPTSRSSIAAAVLALVLRRAEHRERRDATMAASSSAVRAAVST
jgi:hypothetical protein